MTTDHEMRMEALRLFEENERLTNENLRCRRCVEWIETWVSNPVSSYSVDALDGLFGMTRDMIAMLPKRSPQDTE